MQWNAPSCDPARSGIRLERMEHCRKRWGGGEAFAFLQLLRSCVLLPQPPPATTGGPSDAVGQKTKGEKSAQAELLCLELGKLGRETCRGLQINCTYPDWGCVPSPTALEDSCAPVPSSWKSVVKSPSISSGQSLASYLEQ